MNTTISHPLSTLSSRQTTYKSCQALTFNMLIADITRRPPIKLTNRWLVYAEKGKEAARKWLKMLTYYSSCFDDAVSKMGYCPLQYSNTLSDSLLSWIITDNEIHISAFNFEYWGEPELIIVTITTYAVVRCLSTLGLYGSIHPQITRSHCSSVSRLCRYASHKTAVQ